MNAKGEVVHRRILVAFDTATVSRSALEAAARLAAVMEAELYGVFVEDEDLLRAAELPFARQFGVTETVGRAFDLASVESELRALAAQTRRAFAQIARHRNVPFSFKVVRGRFTPEVDAAAQAADLVVLQSSSRPLGRHFRVEALGRAAASALGRSVLLLDRETGPLQRIVALYDGTAAGAKVLRLAARFARFSGNLLRVMLTLDTGKGAELRKSAEAILREEGGAGEIAVLPSKDVRALRRAGGNHKALLVLAVDAPILAGIAVKDAVEALGCPLLLVR